MQDLAQIAFVDDEGDIRVNFGMFAGRPATAAEIDELGRRLLEEVGAITIVSEERHEMDADSEASVHQVVVSVVAEEVVASGVEEEALSDRVVALADAWARSCIADRHAEITEGS
jgi:hypothetical protein